MDTIKTEGKEEIKALAIDALKEGYREDSCELHHRAYNEDYFIIGTYAAKKWLEKNYGVFEAIAKIKEYEELNFGEVYTDLSEPENVCNMLVYILGEEILGESEHLQNIWNEDITDEDAEIIISEIEEV